MNDMTASEREAVEAEINRLGLDNGKCWKSRGVWYVGTAIHVPTVNAPLITSMPWTGSGPCVIDMEVAK